MRSAWRIGRRSVETPRRHLLRSVGTVCVTALGGLAIAVSVSSADDPPDTTPPTTTITAPADHGVTMQPPTFLFAADEAVTRYDCAVDSGPATQCMSGYKPSLLDDGPHTFSVYATDLAGNVEVPGPPLSFSIDSMPPNTTIVSPADGTLTKDPSLMFVFHSDDATATFQCHTEGTALFLACPSPYSPSVPDGVHTLTVRAKDPAGNTDPNPDSVTFTLDTVPPDTVITDPPEGTVTADPTTSFVFHSTQVGSTFECQIDNGGYAGCQSPYSVALAQGSHSFAVRATDPAGNTNPEPATRSVSVDRSVPSITIDNVPTLTNDARPSISFHSDTTGATFHCTLDGDVVSCPSSPYTPDHNLSDDSHTFTVYATKVGTQHATPATATFTVDRTPPDTRIISGPQNSDTIHDPKPTFAFAAPETLTFVCRVDGGAEFTCPNPYTVNALSDGSHTFSVAATDLATNRDPSPDTRTFDVDTTVAPPPPPPPPPPPNPGFTATVAVTKSLAGGGSGPTLVALNRSQSTKVVVTLTVTSDTAGTYAFPLTVTGLKHVQAKPSAGYQDETWTTSLAAKKKTTLVLKGTATKSLGIAIARPDHVLLKTLSLATATNKLTLDPQMGKLESHSKLTFTGTVGVTTCTQAAAGHLRIHITLPTGDSGYSPAAVRLLVGTRKDKPVCTFKAVVPSKDLAPYKGRFVKFRAESDNTKLAGHGQSAPIPVVVLK